MSCRDWSQTVWPGIGLAVVAAFGIAETLAYRSDPDEHPERLTLSRASQRWLRSPAVRLAFLASPWLYLYHLHTLPERRKHC